MSVKNLRLKSVISGVLIAAAVSATAVAQEKITLLEEIVVTAQKREESLQEVPIAISVFTSEARDQLGIITVQDFTDFTPGITYSTTLDRMSVRGIGRQTNNLAVSASVATYGDGVYNASNHQADTSTMFTEAVEVLRGPQGTLYGRNSIGGTLNVKLKRPKNEFGGEVRAIGGNFGRKEIEGTITGPLAGPVNFRLGAGLYKQDSGFVDNIVPGKDDGYGQRNDKFALLMLDGKLGDTLDFFYKFAHSEWDQGYGTSVSLAPYSTTRSCSVNVNVTTTLALVGTTNPATGQAYVAPSPGNSTASTCRPSLNAVGSLGPSALYNTGVGVGGAGFDLLPASPQYTTQNPGVLNPRQVNWDQPSHDTLIPDNTHVLEVVAHLGFADLKYIGGYHNYEYILHTDFDNSDRAYYDYTSYFSPTAIPAAGIPASSGCSATTCAPGTVRIFSNVVFEYIEKKRYYSNELNLISTGDGPVKWVGGLYQYHEYYDQPLDTYNANQTQLQAPSMFNSLGALVPAPANPRGSYQYADTKTTTESMAAFGQVDWNVIDPLTVTLGLRYTKDKKHGTELTRRVSWNPTYLGPYAPALDITNLSPASGGFGTYSIYGAIPDPDGSGAYKRWFAGEWSATTGTANVSYKPFDGANTYLRYSRGYKDGGINAAYTGGMVPEQALYTDPEYVNAYEFGWKQEIGGQFQANLSIFYYDYIGAQYPLTVVNNVGTNTPIFNIDSISRGLELETIWHPIADLQFMFNYAYLNTHLKDRSCYPKSTYTSGVDPKACGAASPTGGLVYIFGNDVPGSPENKISFSAKYDFVFNPGKLSLMGSYVWRDEQSSSVFGGAEWVVPQYGKTDARVTWTDADNAYSIIGYVRNVFDQAGFDGVSASSTSSGIQQSYSLTPPRQYGVELQYRFGSAK